MQYLENGYCTTVALRFIDLDPQNELAKLKSKRIQHWYDPEYHANDLKTSEDQTEVPTSKEIENSKQEIANLKKETVDLTNEMKELKGKKEALSKTLDEKDFRLDSLKIEIKQNKINQEKELRKYDKNHAKNIQELKDEFKREIEEADHSFKKEVAEVNEVHKRLNQDLTTLKTENVGMGNELKECEVMFEFLDKNYFQSYIALVCLNLLANMYHYVLPDQFAEDLPYKVKDIEEDIEDEYLLDDNERQEALKRWKALKGKLNWEPSLEKTLKILQKEGIPMDLHEGLVVEEAERVAEVLNQQGRLKGRTSYEKVKKIIDMWVESTTLVKSLL